MKTAARRIAVKVLSLPADGEHALPPSRDNDIGLLAGGLLDDAHIRENPIGSRFTPSGEMNHFKDHHPPPG